jgi:hypothetical protein
MPSWREPTPVQPNSGAEMSWQPAGSCLLCTGELRSFSSRTSGTVTVKCTSCGSVWTGPIGKAEDVATAAAQDRQSRDLRTRRDTDA